MKMSDSPSGTGRMKMSGMAGLDMNNKKSALPPGVYGTFFRPPIGPFRGGDGLITRAAGHFW